MGYLVKFHNFNYKKCNYFRYCIVNIFLKLLFDFSVNGMLFSIKLNQTVWYHKKNFIFFFNNLTVAANVMFSKNCSSFVIFLCFKIKFLTLQS